MAPWQSGKTGAQDRDGDKHGYPMQGEGGRRAETGPSAALEAQLFGKIFCI